MAQEAPAQYTRAGHAAPLSFKDEDNTMIDATVSELTAAYDEAIELLTDTGIAVPSDYMDLDEFLDKVTAPDFDPDKAWGYCGWSSQNFRSWCLIEPLSIAYLISGGDDAYWWVDAFGELDYRTAVDTISDILCRVCSEHGVEVDEVEFDIDEFLSEASTLGYEDDVTDACDICSNDILGRGYQELMSRIDDMIDWDNFESDDDE